MIEVLLNGSFFRGNAVAHSVKLYPVDLSKILVVDVHGVTRITSDGNSYILEREPSVEKHGIVQEIFNRDHFIRLVVERDMK